MSDQDKLIAALRDVHKLFEDAMLVQGMACVPCAELLGWTVKHAGAINLAARNPSQSRGEVER